MRSRWAPIAAALPLVLLTLTTGCQTGDRWTPVQYTSEAWPFGKTQGLKLTTPHYVIYTTLTEPVLVEALPDFTEKAYANYRGLVPPIAEPQEKMEVYFFQTRGQWTGFTKKFTGPRAATFLKIRNGGYSERGTSVMQYVNHAITFPLFAHEGFHQYVHHCVNRSIPPWLNEGLAVYCEGQRWGDKGVKTFDPWFNPSRRNDLAEALLANRLHPLSELLRTHAGAVLEGSSDGVASYYAQLWALVLFLREGELGKYAGGFRQMLDSLSTADLEQRAKAAFISAPEGEYSFGEGLFRSFITNDLERFEQEYVAFMKDRFLYAQTTGN